MHRGHLPNPHISKSPEYLLHGYYNFSFLYSKQIIVDLFCYSLSIASNMFSFFLSLATENKLQLLAYGALEYLVKLISHEDKLVKRNAVMCVGIVSSEGKYVLIPSGTHYFCGTILIISA